VIRNWLKSLRKPKARNRPKVERAPTKLPTIDLVLWGPRFIAVAAIAFVVISTTVILDRPVRNLEVIGAFRRVSVLDVERVVRSTLKGGFVRANIGALQGAVEQLPWVDNARIQRRWPDTLIIAITEQEAVARWGDSGLINARGELFVRDERHVPMELPKLDGPEGAEHRVSEEFFQIRAQLESASIPVEGVRLDQRGAWEIQLVNGVVVRLGRREFHDRLDRFMKAALGVITSRASEIAYIDMRYSNGFSVGWRKSNSDGLKHE
jgi:cell division protein FtsQ